MLSQRSQQRPARGLFVVVNYYRAMHYSAKRGLATACRPSVCRSVCLSVCDVGGLWSHRLEILEINCSDIISSTPSLFVVQRPSIHSPGKNGEILGRLKILKPVHTVAEKCDSRRISPLSRRFRRQSHFSATVWTARLYKEDPAELDSSCEEMRGTDISDASRGHLCDSTAFLLLLLKM